jgi:hypothetical protein
MEGMGESLETPMDAAEKMLAATAKVELLRTEDSHTPRCRISAPEFRPSNAYNEHFAMLAELNSCSDAEKAMFLAIIGPKSPRQPSSSKQNRLYSLDRSTGLVLLIKWNSTALVSGLAAADTTKDSQNSQKTWKYSLTSPTLLPTGRCWSCWRRIDSSTRCGTMTSDFAFVGPDHRRYELHWSTH